MGLGKLIKQAGFRNARQVLAKVGSSNVGKAVGRAIVKNIQSYKKGGRVRKTGLAYLHKGEHVLPVHRARKYRKRRGH